MYYPMENIENFRDLGGIETKDGKKVKAGMLFRCADLFMASESDIAKIKELGIDTIIDFRSSREALIKKEPEIRGVRNIGIRLFKEKLDGVERNGKEDPFYERMAFAEQKDPGLFARNMVRNYSSLICEEQAVEGYSRFLAILAGDDCDRVVWHCSAGKDRTGIAAILLLEALDGKEEQIREDYLKTNLYLGKSLDYVMGVVKDISGEHEHYEAIRDSFAAAMSANERFIDACYQTMMEKAGSPSAYLEKVFHVDEKMKKKLKEKYCE